MGPESAKSFPGQQLVGAAAEPEIIATEPRPDIPLAGPQPEVSSPVAQPHPLSDGTAQVQPEVKAPGPAGPTGQAGDRLRSAR
jgi:hypothetical protein